MLKIEITFNTPKGKKVILKDRKGLMAKLLKIAVKATDGKYDGGIIIKDTKGKK